MSNPSATSTRLCAPELRATVSLAAIFALRMLGLFMIMPVFSIYAKTIPGGDNVLLVGIALGAYGVTQSMLYIFYGWISDKLGRKPVIAFGLMVFAIGSFVAAVGHSMAWIIAGRVIQGMGAVSSAVIAFIADLTHEENRTKAMAMVGGEHRRVVRGGDRRRADRVPLGRHERAFHGDRLAVDPRGRRGAVGRARSADAVRCTSRRRSPKCCTTSNCCV